MARPFQRKPKPRMVGRSFRVPEEVDIMLEKESEKKGWTKTFLIKEIIVSWFNYNKSKWRV